jgi:hypothetical protein
VISNNNNKLTQGDFISFIRNERLAARALVVKVQGQKVGIKVLKIYSLNLWSQLRPNLQVQILKGDDSYYTGTTKEIAKLDAEVSEDLKNPRINDEEDLYNEDTILKTEASDPEKLVQDRPISSDNLVSFSFGRIRTVDQDSDEVSATQWQASWAYQFLKNVWAEGNFGISKLKQFPSDGFESTLLAITARVKYSFQGPFHTFFVPYTGFQLLQTTGEPSDTDLQTLSDEERDSVDDALANAGVDKIIYGVTFMRRLVPGWFVKLDLGNDILNIGLSVEF